MFFPHPVYVPRARTHPMECPDPLLHDGDVPVRERAQYLACVLEALGRSRPSSERRLRTWRRQLDECVVAYYGGMSRDHRRLLWLARAAVERALHVDAPDGDWPAARLAALGVACHEWPPWRSNLHSLWLTAQSVSFACLRLRPDEALLRCSRGLCAGCGEALATEEAIEERLDYEPFVEAAAEGGALRVNALFLEETEHTVQGLDAALRKRAYLSSQCGDAAVVAAPPAESLLALRRLLEEVARGQRRPFVCNELRQRLFDREVRPGERGRYMEEQGIETCSSLEVLAAFRPQRVGVMEERADRVDFVESCLGEGSSAERVSPERDECFRVLCDHMIRERRPHNNEGLDRSVREFPSARSLLAVAGSSHPPLLVLLGPDYGVWVPRRRTLLQTLDFPEAFLAWLDEQVRFEPELGALCALLATGAPAN